MSNYIKIIPIALFLAAGLASATTDQMSYTITGTGSGYWGSQQFTNATFTFTQYQDVDTILHGDACCASLYTASVTAAWMNVAGFPVSEIDGGSAFVNQATNTAGIWHRGGAEFLTVANPAFANYNLSTNIGPVNGTTFAYNTPLYLYTAGVNFYFTSVSGVTLTAQRSGNYGELSTVSMTPASGNATIGTSQTYTFTFADTLGAADLQNVDILFENTSDVSQYDPDSCWINLQPSTQSFSIFRGGKWSAPVQPGGANLTGNECTVDMQHTSFTISQNLLTLTLSVAMTPAAAPATFQIAALAANQNASTNYQQMGTVSVSPAVQPDFTLTVTPNGPQALGLGSGPSIVSYTVTVVPTGGFNGPVNFSTAVPPNQNPLEFGVSFNPWTLNSPGSTILTVRAMPATVPGSGYVTVIGQSPAGGSATVNTGNIYVANAAPALFLAPNPGSTAQQVITVTATDPADVKDINGVNLLIAPTLDGRNACWVYYDGTGLWLATDDATSWMYAGAMGSATTASNSQCTVGGTQSSATQFTAQKTLNLAIPVTFHPSYAGGKTVFLRASNLAGFDSGYQPLGIWSVP